MLAFAVTSGSNAFLRTPDDRGGMTHLNLYVGTSGYSYKEWKGTFYPKDLPARHMLHFYGTRFRTVEINSTFNGTPKASVVEAWAEAVRGDFKFAIKAPRQITHLKRLKDADDLVANLLEAVARLSRRQGPVLFQLPPTSKKDVPRLRAFLALLPKRRSAALEFRHPSWFDDEVFGLLRDHRAALCVADAEGDLEVPFEATADWGYVRLRRPDYSDAELKKWIKRIQKQDWRSAFVYFRHEGEGKGPRMAQRFMELTA
jgi:uncharacterized protein YecE (DUF72 family)